MLQTPKPRLWVLLAREAQTAVVLRRGPSKQVQLIKWNLADDTFECGQWLKARVYERRCDLSPNGELFIYFAATNKEPLCSWTAVSKPPFFTALALWPKGDGWNGGGHFVGPYEIHLDHFAGEDAPHPDFVEGCRKLRISSRAKIGGEDKPVWHYTLKRDGWVQIQPGGWSYISLSAGWKANPPEKWQKANPSGALKLDMLIEGIGRYNHPWYTTRYVVIDTVGEQVEDLGLTDWADWDRQGDLLFARQGCLYRQSVSNQDLPTPVKLIDLTPNKFEAIKPTEMATPF